MTLSPKLIRVIPLFTISSTLVGDRMKLLLIHGKDHSELVYINNNNVNEYDIIYTRKIHKFEAKGDFSMANTELQTYGVKAMIQVLAYFKNTRG
jgi:hypothetical protein